jgi:hypothetical protein
MTRTKPQKLNRRTLLNASATAACAMAANSSLSQRAIGKPADEPPTFRRPKTIIRCQLLRPNFSRWRPGFQTPR